MREKRKKRERITGRETQWNCCFYSSLSITPWFSNTVLLFSLPWNIILLSLSFANDFVLTWLSGRHCYLPLCFTAHYTVHDQIVSIFHILLQKLMFVCWQKEVTVLSPRSYVTSVNCTLIGPKCPFLTVRYRVNTFSPQLILFLSERILIVNLLT